MVGGRGAARAPRSQRGETGGSQEGRSLDEQQAGDPLHVLLQFSTQAVNAVEIADVIRMAASTGRGVMFCIFEDL
jgi:hypothetical protein